MQRIGFFAGSFNPFTKGHANIVERSLSLFDKVIIGIGQNSEKPSADTEKNADEIAALYKNNPKIKVIIYEGLTAEVAKQNNATHLIRGIRNNNDIIYESEIAQVNYTVFGLETIFLLADPALSSISSSVVRELKKYGKDISNLLP